MTMLRDIQEGVQAFILENDFDICHEIVKPANMTVEARLAIYRNAYYLRVIEILKNDFSVLKDIIGDEVFSSMLRNYLDTYPSHHFSLRTVGRHLAKFLKNTEGCDPCFSELAEFEWALNEALFAVDKEMLTMGDLAAIPAEQWVDMQLVLHPSVRIVLCRFNTVERWQSVKEEKTDIESIKLEKPCHYLIWRCENESYFCALTPEESYLIHALAKEESFGTLCETMLEHFNEDEVVQWVANTLQEWVSQGVFCHLAI